MIKTESIAGHEYLGRFHEILFRSNEKNKYFLIKEFGEKYCNHSDNIPVEKISRINQSLEDYFFNRSPSSFDLINSFIKTMLMMPCNGKKPSERDIMRRVALILADSNAARCIKCLDKWQWSTAIEYHGRSQFYIGIYAGFLSPTEASDFAKRGAKKKLEIDPKQHAKQEVKICWELNKNKYKSKAAFAKDMLGKYEVLESQRVIERWCKKWEAELSQQST